MKSPNKPRSSGSRKSHHKDHKHSHKPHDHGSHRTHDEGHKKDAHKKNHSGSHKKPSEGLDNIISGFHPVDELIAITGFYEDDQLFISRDPHKRVENLLVAAKKKGVGILRVSSDELSEICRSERHQGIVLKRARDIQVPVLTPEMLVKDGLYVAVESIQDPGNLGTIIRSMVAFGAKGLVIAKHDCAPLGQSALKSSAGGLLSMPVMYVSRLPSFLLTIEDDPDACIIGTSLEGQAMSADLVKSLKKQYRRIFILLGSEQKGLSPLAQKRCHQLLRIQQNDRLQSINVSQAASIILHEFYRES